MTYDFHGDWESVIGHHSPWVSDGKHPQDPNNQLTVETSANNWIARGCSPSKMTLGLGAYGRTFKTLSGINQRLQPGTASGTDLKFQLIIFNKMRIQLIKIYSQEFKGNTQK